MAIQPFPQQQVVGGRAKHLPGQVRNTTAKTSEGRVAEGALRPGQFVVRGTDPGKEVAPPSDSDTVFYGVTIRSNSAISAGTPDGKVVDVLQAGHIAVEVENAVTAGGLVYVRTTAGVGEELGAVRGNEDDGDAVPTPWIFTEDAGAGETVVISSVGGMEAYVNLVVAAAIAAIPE
jgi:hypothetical protein